MKIKSVFEYYHWFVYTLSVLFALAKFKNSAEKYFFQLSLSDFEDGWSIINRPKDVSDFEWAVLTSTFKEFYPLLVFQIIISTLLRKVAFSVLPFFYTLYAVLSLTIILGNKGTLFILAYIILMFTVHLLGKKSICYVLVLCSLIVKNSSYILDMKILVLNGEKQSFLFEVAFTWIMAKSLSFMCDRINLGIHNHVTFWNFFVISSYCLYLPTIFTGPILSYEPFASDMSRLTSNTSIVQKVKHFLYLMLCYLTFEIMLHFVYSSSIQYYPHVATQFDSWSLCGLGYALPAMFFFKYFLIYSVARSLSSFENFEFPPPPKCISCIHLSSFLWRHFDRGLYIWILRYLYHPLMQSKPGVFKKIFALATCFSFVCLWHNIDKAVCMWTFLNFLLLVSEMLMMSLSSSRKGKKYLPAFLYEAKYYAVLTTPHFIMMCISSTFFLSNWDIGVLLFQRSILTGVIVPLFLIMYCGCRVSLDVRQWEENHQCCSVSYQKYS